MSKQPFVAHKKPVRIAPSRGESFFRSPLIGALDETENSAASSKIFLDSPGLTSQVDSSVSLASVVSNTNENKHYIPPWNEPYIIGVAGTSGSGKTSVASKIIEELNTPWTVLISLDNFYQPLEADQSKKAFANEWDFDSPNAVDLDLCYECVKSLKEGNKTKIPVYSFAKHNRTGKEITIYGANVIIIEGIYALYHPKLLELMNLKIYVDTDLDICLARRLSRDILFRGRDLKGALKQWTSFVKPNAERFVKPTMQEADLVIPRGADNYIAIDMMIKHIQKQLVIKSKKHLKYLESLKEAKNYTIDLNELSNLMVLKQNNQINSIHTILINKDTSRDDFIFYFNRITTILINKALECLTYVPSKNPVLCPSDYPLDNPIESAEETIAVNIIRSGDCFMTSLKRTYPEIKIGKLLIQSDSKTGEPQLHSIMLPKDLSNEKTKKKFLLMDAQIISGAAVIMSIQVLLDHGVNVDDIIIVCYLATEQGIRRVLSAFDSVKIVVARIGSANNNPVSSSVSKESDSDWWFRTRFIDTLYYGT